MQRALTIRIGLALCALCIGVAVFFSSSYQPSTLVIETRTLEAGKRRIITEDANSGKRSVLWFEIGNSTGENSFYPVELAAILPKSITIDPLAGRGKFEIDRIMLYNESITYSWDSQGKCVRKYLNGGKLQKEACAAEGPLLVTNDDFSVTISSIPENGFVNPLAQRIAIAMATVLGSFFFGFWFCRPVREKERSSRVLTYAARLVLLVLAACCLFQFYLIYHNAVDVPFWDEWEYFKPDALQQKFSLSWIYQFALYHRIVLTKVMAWINFKLFGLNFAWQKMFNYLIFIGLIGAFLKLKKLVVGDKEFALFPAFLVFLTSSIAYENHLFSYQSQIHFVLLFAVLALYFAYEDGVSTRSTILFSVFMVAAINSFSAGVVFSGVFLMCRSVYIAMLMVQNRITAKQGWLSLGVSCAIIGAGILLWFSGYETPSDANPLISLYGRQFWRCYLDLVSLGFGFDRESMLPGLVCMMVTICPVVMLLSQKRTSSSPGSWQVATGIMGVLTVLAAIAKTRGSLLGAGKTSRYAEIGFMLVPLAALAWWLVLPSMKKRIAALLILWLLLSVSYFDNWTANPYRVSKQTDLFLLENLENYEKEGGDLFFPETYLYSIKAYYERSRELDVHFTRQFAASAGEK